MSKVQEAYSLKGEWRVQIQYRDGSWHTCCWTDGTPYQYATCNDALTAIEIFSNNHIYRAVTILEISSFELYEATIAARAYLCDENRRADDLLPVIETLNAAINKAKGE